MRILLGLRRSSDGHVVAETCRADGAPSRDVGDEIAPETDDMVLVIASAAELKRHADFRGAAILGQCRICERVIRIPHLHLLDLSEVVASVERYHLDVRLGEVAVGASAPGEPERVAHARGPQDSIPGEAAAGILRGGIEQEVDQFRLSGVSELSGELFAQLEILTSRQK